MREKGRDGGGRVNRARVDLFIQEQEKTDFFRKEMWARPAIRSLAPMEGSFLKGAEGYKMEGKRDLFLLYSLAHLRCAGRMEERRVLKGDGLVGECFGENREGVEREGKGQEFKWDSFSYCYLFVMFVSVCFLTSHHP